MKLYNLCLYIHACLYIIPFHKLVYHDVNEEASVARANERVKKSTEDAFRDTVRGYVTVIPEHSSIRLQNARAKYALYPVWVLNTTWNGNKYTFAMNGQTGKFVGNLPLDRGAYWKYFGIYTGIAAAVAYAIGRFIL